MRENELEKRQMEMAKILAILNKQQEELKNIKLSQKKNEEETEQLYTMDTLDIGQLEGHRTYGIKLTVDEANQLRIIANTRAILEKKQLEVQEAHKKVEVLKKLKEKQEDQYYKDFLAQEVKEIDDMTSARFKL